MNRMIAIALVVAAVAAPTAFGQSPIDRILAQERAHAHDPGIVQSAAQADQNPVQRIIAQERARAHDPSLFGVPATTLVQTVEPGGFDWGDAGIGAGTAIGLMLLASATAMAVRHGRVRSA
jgi:hypothetical protein